jgi:hypothetical protein
MVGFVMHGKKTSNSAKGKFYKETNSVNLTPEFYSCVSGDYYVCADIPARQHNPCNFLTFHPPASLALYPDCPRYLSKVFR